MYAGAGASRFLLWPVVGEGDGILTLGQDGMGSLILNKWKHGVGAPDEDLHILTQAPIMYGKSGIARAGIFRIKLLETDTATAPWRGTGLRLASWVC